MKQIEDIEEWLHLWNKELTRILKEDGDVYKELEAWQLLNPAPKLKKEQEVKITIPKMK